MHICYYRHCASQPVGGVCIRQRKLTWARYSAQHRRSLGLRSLQMASLMRCTMRCECEFVTMAFTHSCAASAITCRDKLHISRQLYMGCLPYGEWQMRAAESFLDPAWNPKPDAQCILWQQT